MLSELTSKSRGNYQFSTHLWVSPGGIFAYANTPPCSLARRNLSGRLMTGDCQNRKHYEYSRERYAYRKEPLRKNYYGFSDRLKKSAA
jgi:hypothetical protein